jgi:hypothetical protein
MTAKMKLIINTTPNRRSEPLTAMKHHATVMTQVGGLFSANAGATMERHFYEENRNK